MIPPIAPPYDMDELLKETSKNGRVGEAGVDAADGTVRKLDEQITWLLETLSYMRELKDDLATTSAWVRGKQNG